MRINFLVILLLCIAGNVYGQVTETAMVTVPGSLNTVARAYLSKVNNLTVTGTINAVDFTTMSDSMPSLTVLNLSGTTIEAYTGSDGTNYGINYSYAANSIPVYAFYNQSILTTVTLPSNVTSIEDSAFFGCFELSGSFVIPASVTSVGLGAFSSCSALKGFTVDSGNNSFSSLNGVLFNKTQTTLLICPGGKSGTYNIPSTVSAIGPVAFWACTGLTGSLIIPSSVISIGEEAFYLCTGFKGSLTIPSSVTSIGSGAFKFCTGLSGSLIISDSLASINESTFEMCTGFTGSLTIPSSVTSIGQNAFSGCSGFTGTLAIASSVTTIYTGAFEGCSGFTGSLNIPASLNSIGSSAFYNDSGFNGTLTINSKLANIGDYTFYNCSGFTGLLNLPVSVISIGKEALFNCKGFTGSLNLPALVTSVDYNAFFGCYGFSGTLTISSSISYIGDEAFGQCYGLNSVNSLNPIPLTGNSIGSNIFLTDNITNLYVPCGAVNIYKSASQWNSFTIGTYDNFVPITASSGYLTPGSSVTFTADTECIDKPVTLQWQVNGKNEGTGDITFSYFPENGDTILCRVSLGDTTLTSNYIVMSISAGLNIVQPSSFSIYPNPNDGTFYIKFSNPDDSIINITITDITGKKIFETNTSGNLFKYSGNHLTSGLYILNINGNSGKFIVK